MAQGTDQPHGYSGNDNSFSYNANYSYPLNNLTIPMYPDRGFDLKEVFHMIHLYVPPVLIFIGTFGNVLVLLTLRQRNLNRLSVCVYFAAYAIGNLLMLYLTIGTEWMSHILEKPSITSLADWICRLWQFLEKVITFAGIWFVVAMTIDRHISIWHPEKADAMCTKFMAKFAVISIIVGLVVISIHAMWIYELMPTGCYMLYMPNDLHVLIWPWLSASCYSFIPMTLLFLFDIILLLGICLKHPLKQRQNHDNTPVDITYLTLALSMLFFLLSAPATVINIVDYNIPPAWVKDSDLMFQLNIARLIGQLMLLLNPGIFFFVCMIVSSTMRREMFNMIGNCTALCFKHHSRIYEMQVKSNGSTTQLDMEACSETTPL